MRKAFILSCSWTICSTSRKHPAYACRYRMGMSKVLRLEPRSTSSELLLLTRPAERRAYLGSASEAEVMKRGGGREW